MTDERHRIEAVAKAVYAAMGWALKNSAAGEAPAWVQGGNSTAQVEARRTAAEIVYGLPAKPVPMILNCPACHARHVEQGDFEFKPHHTHACQSCGMVWRPAKVATVGVQFLPGFKD